MNHVFRRVSCETSTRKVSVVMLVTVRHAPLTETLSEIRSRSSPVRIWEAETVRTPLAGVVVCDSSDFFHYAAEH